MLIVLIIIACFVALVVWSSQTNAKKLAKAKAEQEAAATRRRDVASAQKDYFEEELPDWPFQSEARANGRMMLMADETVSRLRLQYVENSQDFEVGRRVDLERRKLRSVSTAPTFKTQTVSKTDYVPISMDNKRSPVGRAVVGGLVAGPAGLMVGAASGLGGRQNIQHKEVVTKETREVRAPDMLVLGLDDLEQPVIKVHFAEDGMADVWVHRIQAAARR